jgi:cytochrome c
MKFRSLLILTLLILLPGMVARADDRGTPDEAKAMAIKAALYLKDSGPDPAFAAFNAKTGPWHDRDLYVFVSGPDHKVLAHGSIPALVGRTLATLKDVDGNSISDKIHAVPNEGWIEYKWQDPVTKAIAPKVSYVVRVGDYFVVVGAYK